MGAGAKTSRNRTEENNWTNNNQNTNTNSTTNSTINGLVNNSSNSLLNTNQRGVTSNDATFNSPQGQSILNALTGSVLGANGDQYMKQAGDTYGRLAGGGVNPYTEDVIKSSNMEADKNFANRLAQTRAGGYRGGTGSNVYQQGKLASDFTAQQEGNNANLRQDAFNQGQTLSLAGASGLGSLGNQQGSLATQILSLLRGQTGTSDVSGQQVGSENNQQTSQQSTQTVQNIVEQLVQALTGGRSGTASNTEGGFSFLKGY